MLTLDAGKGKAMPPAVFRAAEIFDMAVHIERQGIAFYSACKEVIDSSALKETFSYLIEQEYTHIDVFSHMKEDLREIRLPESFAGEYDRHVAAFVQKKVFYTPEEAAETARRLSSVRTAVDWAVEFEQKSIDFYSLIKSHVRSSESAAIERIIQEEKRHIERLNQLR